VVGDALWCEPVRGSSSRARLTAYRLLASYPSSAAASTFPLTRTGFPSVRLTA